jgi:lipopolysaccharide biosynthesis glycosyltransferase
LQETVRAHNPDWTFTLFLVDEIPIDHEVVGLLNEFDQVILAKALNIPRFEEWIRGFDVVEACTAIKGFALDFMLGYGDDVIYLDPDIAVFNSLSVIQELLKTNNVVLTPHILSPENDERAISDNEINTLKYGIFNLGFIAVSQSLEGKRFANWWAWRLYDFCIEDFDRGLFVDQKWINLVPALFENVLIWRHYGANLASWNLSQRNLSLEQDEIMVEGMPLLFLHFSKARSFGPPMTQRYGYHNVVLIHLWRWYIDKLNVNAKRISSARAWAYE